MADPVSIGMMAVGTAISASGTLAQGEASQAMAERQAEQLEAQGDDQYAKSTKVAFERKKEADLLISSARARMAAGGGDASDSSMTERVAKISEQGNYNSLNALFDGKMQRRNAYDNATLKRYGGEVAKDASETKALSTVISGGSKIYDAW